MKKQFLLTCLNIVLLFSCPNLSFTQVKTMMVLSSVTYNSGENDGALAITTDPDENIYVAGYDKVNDFIVIKYNPSLVVSSSQSYSNGFTGNRATGIAIDSMEKNIIVTGMANNASDNYDYHTIKYSPNFVEISSNTYDSGYDDKATSVKIDSKNNIFVTGYVNDSANNYNFYTIKYDSDLKFLTHAVYDSYKEDKALAMAIDRNDNVIVGGYITTTTKDGFIRKYNNNLGVLYSTVFDSGGDDRITGIATDSSGNIIVTGTQYGLTTRDIFLIKYDSFLNIISSTVYDSKSKDVSSGIAIDSNDNVIITGYSGDSASVHDYLILKYDKNFTLISSATYNGGYTDEAMAIAVDASDNVLVTGIVNNANNDCFTIKYAASPKITEISPLYIGETAGVTIKGKGLFSDTQVSFSDTGISTGTKIYIPLNQIKLNVTLSPSVRLGFTTITVTNANGEYWTSGNLAETRLEKTISAGASYLMTANNSIGGLSVSIPAGSFSHEETIMIYSVQPLPGDIRQIGEGIYLSVSPPATPANNLSIKLPYRTSDLGDYPEYGLYIAYYDTVLGWKEITSSVNMGEKTVTGLTTMINSKFAIVKAGETVGIPARGDAAVYPNPYRPGSGGDFDNSELGEGIVFSGFTAGQTFNLTILDLAGRLVLSKSCTANSLGKYLWNTNTDSGGKAATGVYIYRIEASGKEKKGKLSIIR